MLLDTTAPAWARPYLVRHIAVDPADLAATVAAAGTYQAAHELRGALTYMPEHVETTARVAEILRTPTTPAEALARFGNLARLRTVLAQHSLPQPRWAEVFDAESAAAHAESLGYPVLLTQSGIGRTAAAQARNREEVGAAYELVDRPKAKTPFDRRGAILVEEALDGEQVSAETVVLDDEDIRIVSITRTLLGPPPARQPVRHCVFAHDALLQNPILRRIVTRAVQALGIELGVLSVRMRLTRKGPRIIDVSPHLADDLIPLIVKRATGIDLPRIAADLASGRTANLIATRQRAAAVQFHYSTTTGHVRRLTVHRHADRQPLLDRIVVTQELGNHVTSGPYATVHDRIGHFVVLGPDASSCRSTLDHTAQYIQAEVTPSPVKSVVALGVP
ncbi:ATP-grasp domain-containing protein [Streptomyces capoamus]|uniref:ATP-grasp domain-containing protein n=1 Tax=Streptomyces capoamus TaxID=68183 RepID=UPI0016720252|nr:hypothetical protein [Streptomyces capoamus]